MCIRDRVLGRVESTNAVAGTYGVRVSLDAPGGTGALVSSPTFTGTVTLPDGTTDNASGLSLGTAVALPGGSTAITQSTGDNSTKVATTAWVQNQQYLSGSGAVTIAGQVTATEPTGSVWGSATGGAKGAGTINATGLYVNGTAVGSLPSGTQGTPMVNASGSTTYTTSPLYLDATQFSGADACAKINAALTASAGAVPVTAEGFTGTQTCASAPFPATTKGKIIFGCGLRAEAARQFWLNCRTYNVAYRRLRTQSGRNNE